jgi:hypothetical protein
LVNIFSHLLRSNCFTLYLHTSVLPFGSFGQPDLLLVRGDAVLSADFLSCHSLLFVLSLGNEEACCRWKAGVAATEKNRRIAIDEELLITGVSVSEENQRVLNDGVSASWMNDERLLANGVSATKRRMMKGCWQMVFQQQRGETIAGRNCFVDDGG